MDNMLAIERRKRIISILQEKSSVLVPELSKEFKVTEETIRRDLEKLEREGVLKRTYGGAVLNESTNVDLPLNIREVTNKEGKEAIGIKVAEFIEDGDTILLDSSSTALHIASKLKRKKNITVITNSVKVVLELSDAANCKVISTGGTLRENAMSFVGHMAEQSVKNYNVDKAIICCKGVDKVKQITESNEMEAQVKRSMISSADKVYLVVDNTKFDRVAFVKMLSFEAVNIIFTDKKLSEDWEQLLKNYNVEIVYC
jgi:DeoR/GlpR family transcriptional regulator of sugar metabolism